MIPTAPQGPGWYDTEDAPTGPDLQTCIHCGLCLTACPTYRELRIEPDSPRGRIYLMRGLAEGTIEPSDPLLHHLDLCLGCRACETVCPAGVPYGRMLEQARGQLNRRAVRGTPLRMLGEWVLRNVVARRGRMHAAASLLRLGQVPPVAAFMRSGFARRMLPGFAVQGYAMTPPLLPRGKRLLERLERDLPKGARLERRADSLVFHPAGAPRARVAYFTTCVLETMFPEINRESVRLLVIAGAEVVVPAKQECCGALHAHAGLRRDARALAERNVEAFSKLKFEYLVTASAGCGAALRDYGHLAEDDVNAASLGERTRDISEVLDQLGMPAASRPLASARAATQPLRVGYHDPCHLAHAQKVRSAPRRLLAAVPGVELRDLPNSDWCCGSAGIYNLTHPEMADRQLEHKMDAIVAAGVERVVASNPGCAIHMARGARERGLDVVIEHLVEILGRAYPPGAAA